MDFSYDETQQVVARAVSDILGAADPDAAWKALGQAGFLSLGLPAEQGGDGLGLVETGIVLTELGRRALLTPGFPALPLTVFATRHGITIAPDTFLTFAFSQPAAAALALPAEAGEAVTALDISAPRVETAMGLHGAPSDIDGQPAAHRAGSVPFAAEASGVIVVMGDGGAELAQAMAAEADFSSSGIPEYSATLASAAAIDGDPYPYLLAGAAAFADGLLAGALELTTEHLRTREQFGKPLATFQIATALIADVYIASRTMHLAALSLAWGLDSGRDVTTDVEAAAHWLDHEAIPALRTCHHLHGGIGLDVTYPLHRYYSLMKDLVRYVHRSH